MQKPSFGERWWNILLIFNPTPTGSNTNAKRHTRRPLSPTPSAWSGSGAASKKPRSASKGCGSGRLRSSMWSLGHWQVAGRWTFGRLVSWKTRGSSEIRFGRGTNEEVGEVCMRKQAPNRTLGGDFFWGKGAADVIWLCHLLTYWLMTRPLGSTRHPSSLAEWGWETNWLRKNIRDDQTCDYLSFTVSKQFCNLKRIAWRNL